MTMSMMFRSALQAPHTMIGRVGSVMPSEEGPCNMT